MIKHVAAAVIRRADGRVLLLKRSPTHSTNAGKWCFVTGYVEPGETSRQAAIREMGEELGLSGEPIRGGGEVTVATDWGDTLIIHPYLFDFDAVTVTLEAENVAYEWIEPAEVYDYDTVQQLDEDLMSLGLLEG